MTFMGHALEDLKEANEFGTTYLFNCLDCGWEGDEPDMDTEDVPKCPDCLSLDVGYDENEIHLLMSNLKDGVYSSDLDSMTARESVDFRNKRGLK